ncbi:alpha-elapitoxin-As2a-like [Anarrhichthys ocellatus]|uniref:alpha-elapitoxin-As2a-like n=1 Tax=Anarrhichthys ocellatus TaxID=433405 RepID=UPI0012ED1F62|nr:alpha-elapitoxin-As2a-like [Anarrhichthys ocellatus]
MAKIVIAIIAIVASFMMAESLICRKCTYGLGTFCPSSSDETCPTSNYVCFNGTISFSGFSSLGIKSQGCRFPTGCNSTVTSTLLGLRYTSTISCCSTDRCANAAPSTKMTLTAVIGVAALASMWSTIM